MIQNPVFDNESFVKQFEHIGIDLTFGFDESKLDRETFAGLNRAAGCLHLKVSLICC